MRDGIVHRDACSVQTNLQRRMQSDCIRTFGCCGVGACDTQQLLRSPIREDRLVVALRSHRSSPFARICTSPFPPNGQTYRSFLSWLVERAQRRRLEADSHGGGREPAFGREGKRGEGLGCLDWRRLLGSARMRRMDRRGVGDVARVEVSKLCQSLHVASCLRLCPISISSGCCLLPAIYFWNQTS